MPTLGNMVRSMLQVSDSSPDRALFEHTVDGLVVTCYQNERPLKGLAGLMDWRFHGGISSCLNTGIITGKVGECVYFPTSRNGRTYHLLLIGAGFSPQPGQRLEIPEEAVKAIGKNLKLLRLQKIGISRSDFGNVADTFFSRHLDGMPLWIFN